ncbi:hypothetical protein F2P81_008984 [Scophthalmus maximus]|uniref:Uncharacterized protein n=1 Tax=Scophthalmus maximus TaxID=52904 RepID=A0A6A4T389_SCOMX|nr:hypothetical protein F2P81_008984 [Scophthalmus maximus]
MVRELQTIHTARNEGAFIKTSILSSLRPSILDICIDSALIQNCLFLNLDSENPLRSLRSEITIFRNISDVSP